MNADACPTAPAWDARTAGLKMREMMTDMKIRLRVERAWGRDGFDLWVIDYRQDKAYFGKPVALEFEPIDDGAQVPVPTFFIDKHSLPEFLTALSDVLNHFQFITKDQLEQKQVAAMQAHLDDMRKIAFQLLATKP